MPTERPRSPRAGVIAEGLPGMATVRVFDFGPIEQKQYGWQFSVLLGRTAKELGCTGRLMAGLRTKRPDLDTGDPPQEALAIKVSPPWKSAV